MDAGRFWPMLAAAMVAGCTVPTADDMQQFGGSFTESATQPDMDDFRARMMARGADDVLLMESFPVQFNVAGLSATECQGARNEAETLPYIAEARACSGTIHQAA